MKKLITLLVVASLALTIQAQDITNTLGTGGDFLIKSSNGNTLFDFTRDLVKDPELKIGESLNSLGADLYMLQVQSSSIIGPLISFANFHNGSGVPTLRFQKARGATTPIAAGDIIGRINFQGYASEFNFSTNSATIQAVATSTGTTPGAKLEFSTSDGTSQTGEARMTIESNGGVNIANNLDVGGAVNMSYVNHTANFTLDNTHYTFGCYGAGIEVTLPSAVGIKGRIYIIKNHVVATSTVKTTSGQKIDDEDTYPLSEQYKYVQVQSDGSNWIIIGQN